MSFLPLLVPKAGNDFPARGRRFHVLLAVAAKILINRAAYAKNAIFSTIFKNMSVE